jgi:hypothetical protein
VKGKQEFHMFKAERKMERTVTTSTGAEKAVGKIII